VLCCRGDMVRETVDPRSPLFRLYATNYWSKTSLTHYYVFILQAIFLNCGAQLQRDVLSAFAALVARSPLNQSFCTHVGLVDALLDLFPHLPLSAPAESLQEEPAQVHWLDFVFAFTVRLVTSLNTRERRCRASRCFVARRYANLM